MATHNAVGTEAKAAQRKLVWEMYSSGMSKYRIAKVIGCTEANIGQMVKRLVGKYGEPDSQKARSRNLGANPFG